ncbi:MAG TPA: hypothetical protein VIV12_16435, partial [Streptosporangiaceae bacterium]
RSLAAVTAADVTASQGRLVPAQVTTQPPTWVSVTGRTAELHPPRALFPTPPDQASRTGQPAGPEMARLPTVPETELTITPGFLHPVVHPLTGQLVHPITGQPIHPPGPGPELAEATYVEAKQLNVDVSAVTVGEFIDLLVNTK